MAGPPNRSSSSGQRATKPAARPTSRTTGAAKTPSVDDPLTDAKIHIADEVVAKMVAHYTLTVPGVVALRPGLANSVANLAGRFVRPGNDDPTNLSTDGVTVAVDDNERTATVTVDVVLELGVPLLEVAKHIQQQIGANLQHTTGLAAITTINIVDVTEPSDDNGRDTQETR